MATPTRSQAASTPKSHLPSTPNRLMASPRPGSSAVAQKSLAYKSPAVKTPASLPGHTHTASVSSQPSSTPLAANAIHDELLALNSPAAALINSMAPTGLTPITNGHDGLGISTHGQGGIPSSRDGQVLGDPEAQRLASLQQALTSLKAKAVGRGISREAVERVARLQGFEALWDEDNLTIAGNIVEIEINFDPTFKDKILDLVLKLNSANGDSHVQHDATLILKQEIGAGLTSDEADLDSFARNLKYLARMDRVDVSPNSFEIVGNLCDTLRSIWDEEKKHMSWRTSLQHVCRGTIGRPHFDRMPDLGLTIVYLDSGSQPSCRIHVACEAGVPGILASRSWITSDILTQESQAENVLDADEPRFTPDWKDETPRLGIEAAKDQKDQMTDEKALAPLLDVHFSCTLEPEVLVPLNVALKLNTESCPIVIEQAKAMTYQTALQKSRNSASPANDPHTVESRWSRRLLWMTGKDMTNFTAHSYALYPATQNSELWAVPLSCLSFSHPKQLVSAVSVLRQYAVVWNLLNTIVVHPLVTPSHKSRSPTEGRRKVPKRSNKDTAAHLIESSSVSSRPEDLSLPVDITLDSLSDPAKCKLEIFAPLTDTVASVGTSSFLRISLSVGPNGSIDVGELGGVPFPDQSGLKSKLARMLDSTQDIAMILQWLLELNCKSTKP